MPTRPRLSPPLALLLAAAPAALAQDPPAVGGAPGAAAEATLGPADAPLGPFAPLEPRDAAGEARVEAAARLLAGEVALRDGEPEAALDEFLAARAAEPDSAEILRAAVPVAFELGREELAGELAAELSDRDPADWTLARSLAGLRLKAGDGDAAWRYLKRAADSPGLPAAGPDRAGVLRGLALLSLQLQRGDAAADAFAALVPLMSGGEGGLDFRTRRELLSDPATNPLTVARVLLAAGRPGPAAAAFRLALSAKLGEPGGAAGGPNEAPARAALATALQQDDRPGEALAELETLVALDPAGPSDPAGVLGPAASVLNGALADLDRGGELVPTLERWRAKFPDSDPLTLGLAAARADAGDLDAAERDLRGFLETHPGGPGRVTLATVLRKRDDPAAWLETIAAAAEGDESPEARTLEKARAAEDAAFRDAVLAAAPAADPVPAGADGSGSAFAREVVRAELAAAAGRAGEVEAGLRSALARDRGRRFDLLLTAAGVYGDVGRPADAARVVDEALADDGLDDPDLGERRAEFLVVRAQLHRQQGETGAALEKLDAAEALKPGNPFFPFQKAVTLLGTDRPDETIAELERVLALTTVGELAKQSRVLLSSLLVRRDGEGDFERGEALLEEQLALTPDDPTVANDLGYFWADRGVRLGEAEALIRRALAANPENAATLDSLGWVLFKQGRLEEAKAPLLKAGRNMEQGDGTVWSHIGDLWNALGDAAAARDAWRSALQRANAAEVKDEGLIGDLRKKLGRE